MCNFWSCLLTKDGKVLWDKDIKSHEDLIERFGLEDKQLKDRSFVRIEITPRGDILSKKRGDWSYKVDEPGTVPDWYQNDPMAQEKIVWAEWQQMIVQMHQSITDAGVHLERFEKTLEHLKKVNLKEAQVNRSTVRAALGEHVKRLTATDPQHRVLEITEVQFHTLKEWDQLWDQLRGQLYSSILMDDLTDPWYSLIDSLESGCLFMGITKDGIAHVVIVGKDEQVP